MNNSMQIEKINIYGVMLPFTVVFSHSLRKRASVNNIVVEVVANQGKIRGYGEGAPRVYVTGESLESASNNIFNFIQRENFPWDLWDVSQIWNYVDELPNDKKYNMRFVPLKWLCWMR